MALLIKADGELEFVTPAAGHDKMFTLEELQEHVGGYIELVRNETGQLMLADEEGLLKGLHYNTVASMLAMKRIVGNVLILTEKEMGE